MPEADIAFTPLRVLRAEPAAEGIQGFELARDDGADLPPFTAGAHVHVKTPNGLIRRYSLCSDPSDVASWQLAVKRESPGRGGSRALIDNTHEGDLLEVSAPTNDFTLSPRAPSHLLIAGGIGITPLLAMARHLISTGGRPFRLIYLARSTEVMAFRAELSAPAFRGRVVMHCDGGDPAKSYDLWPVLETPKGAHVYCCGPRGLMQSVRDMTGYWPASAVHFEDFGTTQTAQADDTAFTIHLARSGTSLTVPADASILETLRRAGLTIPSSCQSGSCGTCRVGLLEGTPAHRDLVLAEHETARAIITCVSRANSKTLVLDL